jgi:hypothetical protein
MKYWDEFQTKWGFSDGEAVPPDAAACREVYVQEINRLAEQNRSAVRLLAFDRPGVHNCYLIVRVPAALVKDVAEKRLCVGQWEGGWQPADPDWKEPADDEALAAAIREAFDLDLNGYVETEVNVKTRRRPKCHSTV